MSKFAGMLPSEIVKLGWCQKHMFMFGETPFVIDNAENAKKTCLLGGINLARWAGTITADQANRIYSALPVARVNNDNEVSPIGWNDTPGRTQAEVVAALAQAERKIGLRQ